MNNKTIILVLSVVLIATMLPGCVREASEIGAPDAAQPALASEVVTGSVMGHPIFTNLDHMSYQNLSISNAPALNQTARLTYSMIPNRDMEILSVQVGIPDDGFELIDIDDTWPHTRYNWIHSDTNNARWYPTNLSKDTLYQFNATIKAVKTGNWTIVASGGKIYLSVSKDSAYINDEPFPYIPKFRSRSQFEKDLAEQNITPIKSPNYNVTHHTHPRDSIDSTRIKPPQAYDIWWSPHHWNGTAWVEGRKPVTINQSGAEVEHETDIN